MAQGCPRVELAMADLTSPSITAVRDLREASCGPIGAPAVTSDLSENVILTSLDDLHNWARLSSLWPLLYGTACCFIEFAALLGSRFDFDRFGLVPRSSPRQADLLIVAGTVTMKMAPALVRLYEQMPEPKYVIAMGACTITGGMFSADSTTAVRGVDKLIPVDLYMPGCPPRPEAIFDAVIKLRKKVGDESLAERRKHAQTQSQNQGNGYSDGCHLKRDPAAIEHSGESIAAQLISPRPVLQCRP